jgi:hypothetical protein
MCGLLRRRHLFDCRGGDESRWGRPREPAPDVPLYTERRRNDADAQPGHCARAPTFPLPPRPAVRAVLRGTKTPPNPPTRQALGALPRRPRKSLHAEWSRVCGGPRRKQQRAHRLSQPQRPEKGAGADAAGASSPRRKRRGRKVSFVRSALCPTVGFPGCPVWAFEGTIALCFAAYNIIQGHASRISQQRGGIESI